MPGQVKDRLVASSVCFMLCVVINIAAWRWVSAFVKIEGMRIPYVVLISLILSFAFYGFALIRKEWTVLAVAGIGAAAGVVGGTFAITLSNLVIVDGFQRLVVSFERYGAIAALWDVPVSLLLGSWAVGALSFCAAWLKLKRSCGGKESGRRIGRNASRPRDAG
ncbi:hypothetical protein H3005_08590 [Stenotrophomonas sp. Br8]|uniref:hypothetical protein n=1 Tax=Stenotrophomonas TaxID=40323 RepID=UPI001056D5AF|nr:MULTISPECIES: hypothetical protein [Stenotrophomonas]MBD3681918.1 hypothetical protein [Stenotrophomonas sp. Br8]NYU00335.1 hypothetical protein [Stenotrophomonas sp. SbOxS2]